MDSLNSSVMDQEDRPACDVILGFERLGVRFATSVSWRCSPQSVLRMLMRWSVYFKFAQGPPLQCEAVVEGNMIYGRLMTLKEWYPPDREVCLGCHRIGIPDIKKAFLPISSRSVYHAKENNCQTLVVKLLQNLDIPVPHKVCTIASDMKAVFWLRGERVAFNSIVSMVEKAFQCSKKMDELFPRCDYNDFKAMVAMLEEKFVDGRPEESTTDM